jgi:hypothetical protein
MADRYCQCCGEKTVQSRQRVADGRLACRNCARAEMLAKSLENVKAERVKAGLSPMIDDEPTLRMFAAVFASARRRRDQAGR